MRHEDAVGEELTQGKDINAPSLLRHHLKIGGNLKEIQKKIVFLSLVSVLFINISAISLYIKILTPQIQKLSVSRAFLIF